jgi:beta-phosphoglucomutase-like phosphatase (HAD superfamily)
LISAVVLDMDGLLIDTEPVWRAAARDVFAELGVQLTDPRYRRADLVLPSLTQLDEPVLRKLTA